MEAVLFWLTAACIGLVFVGVVMLFAAARWFGEVTAFLGVIVLVFAAIFIACTVVVYCNAASAGPRAALLNKAFGTTYTAEDLFYGDDIVKETIQGSKSNLNLTVEKK